MLHYEYRIVTDTVAMPFFFGKMGFDFQSGKAGRWVGRADPRQSRQQVKLPSVWILSLPTLPIRSWEIKWIESKDKYDKVRSTSCGLDR